MGTHDPRRRYYVVTALRHVHESAEACDERIVAALGVDEQSHVTCSVYDPVADEWTKLKGKAGDGREDQLRSDSAV